MLFLSLSLSLSLSFFFFLSFFLSLRSFSFTERKRNNRERIAEVRQTFVEIYVPCEETMISRRDFTSHVTNNPANVVPSILSASHMCVLETMRVLETFSLSLSLSLFLPLISLTIYRFTKVLNLKKGSLFLSLSFDPRQNVDLFEEDRRLLQVHECVTSLRIPEWNEWTNERTTKDSHEGPTCPKDQWSMRRVRILPREGITSPSCVTFPLGSFLLGTEPRKIISRQRETFEEDIKLNLIV